MVFKEFIEALGNFKFMDFTFILPNSLIEDIKNLSENDMDVKGPTKAIFYDSGANYFKNMVPIITSFLSIIAINFCLYWILKFLPFRLTKRLSLKLKVRFPIIVSDMIEMMVLPAIFYGIVQRNYPVFN